MVVRRKGNSNPGPTSAFEKRQQLPPVRPGMGFFFFVGNAYIKKKIMDNYNKFKTNYLFRDQSTK